MEKQSSVTAAFTVIHKNDGRRRYILFRDNRPDRCIEIEKSLCRQKGSYMKLDTKMMAKLSLIFFGLLFLVCLWLGRGQEKRKEPEGDKILSEDVEILLDALGTEAAFDEGETQNPYLTYRQYIQIYEQINGAELGLPDYADQYEPEYDFLKKDWYAVYRLLLVHLDTESSIWETTIFVLKVNPQTREAYTESGAMQGAYQYCSAAFEENVFEEMKVYVKGDKLLTIVEVLPEEHYLGNVWVMEVTDEVLTCFYHQVEFQVQTGTEDVGQPEREQVADLTFKDGRLREVKGQEKKIHGKLLRVAKDEIEIEGQGIYGITEDMEIYKLYGSMETLRQEDLKIGYADTDFVLKKDRVCACLVSRAEKADKIRVLIRNKTSNSQYHESVDIHVDGEHVRIKAEDMEAGERRVYQSANLTDKVLLELEGTGQENNAYRGAVECYRMQEGIVLINELPLEEYLYAVVPSEMPASYPAEALKAQAVCARTYGYRYILHAGLPQFGAHVDDTTAYQVYHNIAENAASTTAVKETEGILLLYDGQPAQNYYYSTSCGVGTDTGVWQGGEDADTSYMRAGRVSETQSGVNGEELCREDVFREFISTVHEEDLEKEEPWYRWTYTVEKLEEDKMLTRIQERYQAAPAAILTRADGEYYVSEPVEELGKIRDLSIGKRGAGGVAEELLIETEQTTIKVISEYNIRYVLCDGKSPVVRQDDSATVPGTLLPSGFFVLDAGKKGENVVGYTLTGGGYGHGVGMSQNGAKALGERNVSYEQILTMFYPGCTLADTASLNGQ